MSKIDPLSEDQAQPGRVNLSTKADNNWPVQSLTFRDGSVMDDLFILKALKFKAKSEMSRLLKSLSKCYVKNFKR